jgi:signal transduction histidine kinase
VPRHGMSALGTAEPAAGEPTGRRFGLSSWPIRRKLVALVIGPLLVILGAGALVTIEAIGQLREAQDSERVATASLYSNKLAQALQREVISTMTVISTPSKGTRLRLRNDRATTDAAFTQLSNVLADAPRGGWDAVTEDKVQGVAKRRAELAKIRQDTFPKGLDESAIKQDSDGRAALSPTIVQVGYQHVFDAPRALTQRLAQRLATASSDGSTVNTAAAITALAGVSSLAADEVIDLDIRLLGGNLPAPAKARLLQSNLQQKNLLLIADTHATEDQRASIAAISADDGRINSFRDSAIGEASNAGNNDAAAEVAKGDAPAFVSAASQRLSNLDDLVAKIVADAQATASESVRNALVRVGVVGGGALLLLVLVTAFTAAVARSVSTPLRRLRTAAVDTANVRLPDAVAKIEREGPDAQVVMPPALPAGEGGGPETTEVARAVDGLTNEAVRLASAQVRLRRSLDDAFVSMSRRSQSMVEKQLAIIDELERTEEDPEQLRNLFRLDHLAARMRRYNDNLLVLAGSVVRTRTNAPVPIADVFRAATSEMEQYERVRLQPVSGAAVAGPAAGGLIHLLAELLDNAAMYSPPTSPILMAAAFGADGSLRLEITDSGVGIPASELDELNARLANPGNFDMQVPSRMGLYVVARLAQRGGFGVQLAQRDGAAGTIAEVVVPAHLVMGGTGLVATPGALGGTGAVPEHRTPSAPQLPPVAPVPVGGVAAPFTPSREPAVPQVSADTPVGSTPSTGITRPAAPAAPDFAGASALTEAPVAADDERATTTTHIRTPSGITAANLPRRERGDVPPAGEATEAAGAAAGTGPRLPSRRPGAALAGGPLAAVAGGASPFADPPSVPPSASPAATASPSTASPATATPAAGIPVETGQSAPAPAGGRAGGGFGAPGRPFTAGTPAAGRRPAGAGAPSAATAAAAAAAARAARAGGAGPNAASALFAARGPATDGAGTMAPVAHAGPPEGQSPADPAGERAGTPHLGGGADTGPDSGTAAAAAPATQMAADTNGTSNGSSNGSSGDDIHTRADVASNGAEVPGPAEPLSGELPVTAEPAGTPIFDTVSTWFSADGTSGQANRVIDLRDTPGSSRSQVPAGRWSALGDQRWLATNARAAAGPEVSGQTEVGLPRRRPGANLIPSAAAAAPLTNPTAAVAGRSDAPRRTAGVGGRSGDGGHVDADALRGRLSSYQRGLTSARRARHLPPDRSADGLFATSRSGDNDPGRTPGEQGG